MKDTSKQTRAGNAVLTVRVEEGLIEALDAEVKRLRRILPGATKINRSDIVRSILIRHLHPELTDAHDP